MSKTGLLFNQVQWGRFEKGRLWAPTCHSTPSNCELDVKEFRNRTLLLISADHLENQKIIFTITKQIVPHNFHAGSPLQIEKKEFLYYIKEFLFNMLRNVECNSIKIVRVNPSLRS
jgi:hypothetical protein